jgi:hypothetical protein
LSITSCIATDSGPSKIAMYTNVCGATGDVGYGPKADMKCLTSAKEKARILHTECGVGVRRPSPMDLWGRNHRQDNVKLQAVSRQLVSFLSELGPAP